MKYLPQIEDSRDMLPLEYAIEAGSPYSVIKFLQLASEKDWKQRRKESEPGDTHSNIVQKLNRDQQLKQKDRERRKNDLSPPLAQEEAQSKSMFAKTA